jgi:hypothetical protein
MKQNEDDAGELSIIRLSSIADFEALPGLHLQTASLKTNYGSPALRCWKSLQHHRWSAFVRVFGFTSPIYMYGV